MAVAGLGDGVPCGGTVPCLLGLLKLLVISLGWNLFHRVPLPEYFATDLSSAHFLQNEMPPLVQK